MKSESIQALLIDRELGELNPETVELLETWLTEHPESAGAVPAIRRTLETAGGAVRRFPELARPELPLAAPNILEFLGLHFRPALLAAAAASVMLLGGAAWLGFHAGGESKRNAVVVRQGGPAAAPAMNALSSVG